MDPYLKYQQERRELIDKWGMYTAERLQKSIAKKKIGKTGALSYSLMYQLIGGDDVTSVKHEFNYYGKFVDMGVGRGQKLGDVKGNADIRALDRTGRSPKKWFSKSYYAEVMELTELLQEKYGEQSTGIIKESIESTI